MIAVKLEGRLGNQLFQYAFIYAAAQKLNSKFYLDKSIENFIPSKYFELHNDFIYPVDKYIFSKTGYKNIFSVHLKNAFYQLLEKIYFRNKTLAFENDSTPELQLSRLINNRMYIGFFQSEKYFEGYQDEIRKAFTIKKQYFTAFAETLKNITSAPKTVTVHIRRGDYVDQNNTLPIDYYNKAIEKAGIENSKYFFISDDPEYIEKEFSFVKNKYISKNTEIIDLQFLINSDVCILSNSSFSWWGAWLNNRPGKVIYAPKNWLAFGQEKEYPLGISHNLNINWITL